MTQKQKGYVGLGAMAVLAAGTIFGSTPLYKAIDTMAAKSVSYTPGTYYGQADGFGGAVVATVTVNEEGINLVELTGGDETPELGGAALEKLAGKFVEAQSSMVDAVSGCTITSNAAMQAVQQALDQSSGKLDIIEMPVVETKAAKETEAAKEETKAEKKEENRTFAAGTYTGSAKGFGGEVSATVTIADGAITAVELKGNDETEELGGVALEKLPERFVEAQTSTVDAVSGCTITSDAAMEAVEQALAQAAGGEQAEAPKAAETVDLSSLADGTYEGAARGFGGDVSAAVTVAGGAITAVELKGNDETEELGGVALEKLSGKFMEAQSYEVDAVSGSTITSDAAMEAVKQALSQAAGGEQAEAPKASEETIDLASLADGTYEGTAKGFGGEVSAAVTVAGGAITTVELKGNDETEEIGGAALEKLADKFVEAQSYEVDAVSGSTITSDAAMEAVKQALAK